MTATLKKLTARHFRAMELRLIGRTLPEVAEEMGVSASTVNRWFYAEPIFRHAYDELQTELINSSMDRLKGLAGDAVDTVAWLVKNGAPDTVRLSAAKDILDRAGLKAPDQVEISGRDGNPIEHRTEFTEEERAARVAELLEAARQG